jgi:hypothetical protein
MPSGKSWLLFIFINLGVILFLWSITFFITLQDIKDNWSVYRCNPIYFPFSNNLQQDFTYCVQTIQTNYIGNLLQPLTFTTNTISNSLSNVIDEMNSIRAMFDKIRTYFSTLIQSVFGVFLNIIIEFQKIIISMRDLMGKTIGIMVTLMYMIDGSIKTMNSTWNGPQGQIVRTLGKCFYPNTKIQLHNHSFKKIKHLSLGDVLIDGSIVEATMKINNQSTTSPTIHFYKIIHPNSSFPIYVTGEHFVFNQENQQWIPVKEYKYASLSKKTYPYFSCIITNTHRIPIQNELFWDWEDFHLKNKNRIQNES